METNVRVQLYARAVINNEVIRNTELIVSAPQASIEIAKKTISEIHDTIIKSTISNLPTQLYN